MMKKVALVLLALLPFLVGCREARTGSLRGKIDFVNPEKDGFIEFGLTNQIAQYAMATKNWPRDIKRGDSVEGVFKYPPISAYYQVESLHKIAD